MRGISELLDIKSMYPEELAAFLASLGQPRFRARQLFRWLQAGVSSFDEMTDLPQALRTELRERCYIAGVRIVRRLCSAIDGTVKYLYALHDGETVESVLMKYEHGYTVCISTQVGCRMGCGFCASGLNGLSRDLTASEMLAQVTAAGQDNHIRVSNVVMMGMGEPLDNFENTVRFLRLSSHEDGLHIGLRHISLSTSGLVPGIRRLKELNLPITLSVSLHAPNDTIRRQIMPVARRWSIEELLAACRDYQQTTGRRISFEYALISGVNDSDACAQELGRRLRGLMSHVNLIPANPVRENGYRKPDRGRIGRFQALLAGQGINATVRRTLGADINASCGQLRNNNKEGEGSEAIQQN